MAGQYHFAHSNQITGAGFIAGGSEKLLNLKDARVE